VIDNTTQLMWEVKTKQGLQSSFNTYTWFDGKQGVENGVNSHQCHWKKNCNTKQYLKKINEKKICGFDDWRLPTFKELNTLKRYPDDEPTINHKFFPNTQASLYWTSTLSEEGILDVPFFYGGISGSGKEFNSYIRVVRSVK